MNKMIKSALILVAGFAFAASVSAGTVTFTNKTGDNINISTSDVSSFTSKTVSTPLPNNSSIPINFGTKDTNKKVLLNIIIPTNHKNLSGYPAGFKIELVKGKLQISRGNDWKPIKGESQVSLDNPESYPKIKLDTPITISLDYDNYDATMNVSNK